MIRLLIIAGVLVFLYFLVRRAIIQFRGGEGEDRFIQDQDQMIQDPVCRTYIPRSSAVTERIGGQTYFFCSRDCAHSFKKQLSA